MDSSLSGSSYKTPSPPYTARPFPSCPWIQTSNRQGCFKHLQDLLRGCVYRQPTCPFSWNGSQERGSGGPGAL